MDWLIAIVLVLGILTLFGWKGIEVIGRLLGLIGALIILFIGWIILNAFFDKDILIFMGIIIGVIFMGAILYGILQAEQELRDHSEEKKEINDKPVK